MKMANIKIIYGPPCSGKSTYVEENLGDGDIRFDYDLIMQSISNMKSHQYSDEHLPYVVEYRSLLIEKSYNDEDINNTFIIASKITDKLLEEVGNLEIEYILIETTKEQCFEQLENDDTREDKEFWKEKINNWFSWFGEWELKSKAVVNVSREKERQIRSVTSDLEVREESDDEKYLEGYFAVFSKQTELWPGAFEEIDPGAFDKTLGNDIRALINHDTTLVLGRNKSQTLELKIDSRGLWGKIKINPNDTDAINTYERVKRGDVSGNSFGFNILNEETDYREDGTVKWIIKEVDLHEVSICTFPAYEDTNIQARHKEVEQYREKQLELRKKELKERLDKIC